MKKQGVNCFPLDTDFFDDIKVRKIMKACGSSSTSVLICLLCNIYKREGYYIMWDEVLPFVVADLIGTTEGAVNEVVKKAVQVDFFDRRLFETKNILTSNGIQSRFKKMVSKRLNVEYIEAYLINQDEQIKSHETDISSRRNVFYQSLVPFTNRYNPSMLRAFFDYWSELNKSKTKMRFETQKTWETAKRLATWHRNEIRFNRADCDIVLKDNSTEKYKDEGW